MGESLPIRWAKVVSEPGFLLCRQDGGGGASWGEVDMGTK